MRHGCLAISLAVLVGCSNTSGVVRYGADSYVVASSARTTVQTKRGQTEEVIETATDYCSRQGKIMMPDTLSSEGTPPYSGASASLVFRCLDPEDPELQEPEDGSAPRVTIDR